jgi:hypothetical protein
MTVEAFTDREGKQANTATEKEVLLRCEALPPSDDDQYYEVPPARKPTHMRHRASS